MDKHERYLRELAQGRGDGLISRRRPDASPADIRVIEAANHIKQLQGEVKQFNEGIEYVLGVSLSIRPDDALWAEILRLQAELRQLQQKGGV